MIYDDTKINKLQVESCRQTCASFIATKVTRYILHHTACLTPETCVSLQVVLRTEKWYTQHFKALPNDTTLHTMQHCNVARHWNQFVWPHGEIVTCNVTGVESVSTACNVTCSNFRGASRCNSSMVYIVACNVACNVATFCRAFSRNTSRNSVAL